MSGWDCTICTFYNKNSAFKCKMCGASRGTSTRQAKLPDQPLMQLEPPAKKARFSKSRVETSGKSVAKQSKTVNRSDTSSSAAGSSDCTSGRASGASQKQKNAVEKVIVERPVFNGDIKNGQYVPQWDPYVMVETVSNVRLFSNVDSEAYTTPHITISGVRASNVTSLPATYENKHAAVSKGESSQQSVKAKGCSKKAAIPYPHSGKEKGPQKAKTLNSKGKRYYQRNKDGHSSLSDVSSSNPAVDNKDIRKQTKSFSKQTMRTTSSGHSESSRQKQQHGGESSRPHSSHRTWPTIPNLDYASGKQLQVTFNNETVFITQYKLLQ